MTLALPQGAEGYPRVSVRRLADPGPVLVAVHLALALAMMASSAVATAHAAGVVVLCVVCALGARRIETIAWVSAYVASCDVLWRMTKAQVFYEGAKYLVGAVLLIGLLRFFRGWRSVGLPSLYLATFMPAVVLSFLTLGLAGGARGLISANLSGPIALAVAVLFFSQVGTDVAAIRGVLWALLAPIAGIAAVAANATRTAGAIEFKNASNFVTSAGFGPNQVSAILGLGVLACLLLALTEGSVRWQIAEALLGLGLLAQGLLTFSRGGIVNLLVAVVVAVLFLVRNVRRAARLIAVLAIFAAVLAWVLVPRLDAFTQGALGQRYTSFDTTNRGEFAQRDVDIFRDRPITGVGAGVASEYRTTSAGERVAAHTEFTRMLAEQGLLGAIGILALGAIGLRTVLTARRGLPRAFAAGLSVWSLTVMTNAAMRVATISFVFGLAVLASNLTTDDVEMESNA